MADFNIGSLGSVVQDKLSATFRNMAQDVTVINSDKVLKQVFMIRLNASFKKLDTPEGFSGNDIYVYGDKQYTSLEDYISDMADDIISDESNLAVQQVKSELETIDILINSAFDLSKDIKAQVVKLQATTIKMKADFVLEKTKLAGKMATDVAQYSIPLVTASAAGPGTAIALPLAKGITNIYNSLMEVYTNVQSILEDIVDDLSPTFDNEKAIIGSLLDVAKEKISSLGLDLEWYSVINLKIKGIELLLK